MTRLRLAVSLSALLILGVTPVSAQDTEVRVGWCTPNLDPSSTAPFAVADEFGWFAQKKIKVKLVPLAGSGDCVLNVTTGQVKTAFAAPEAVAIVAAKGVPVQYFYTGFNRNMFGIAVPASGKLSSYKDLEGKRIGVLSMSSVGVVVAKSVIEAAGMNPDTDVKIVVSGSPAQSKNLLENGEIAAISMWDMVYETIASAGLPLRKLPDPGIDNFPSNGFVALQSTIEKEGDILAAVARGYAMGSIYIRDNPEAAARLSFKHFPQTRSTGLSEDEDVKRSLPNLTAVTRLWTLPPGRNEWGFNDAAQYQSYIDWLVARKVFETKLTGQQIVSNALIKKINDFDPKVASKPK
jgi:NitT/TauT family transport system substrate-binding protein